MTEHFKFEAEVTKLLKIVANSLYSNKEIFLRELISNASDACDKLRYELQSNPKLIASNQELEITITPNLDKKQLIIEDNGIGMSKQELIENLGTIARSGTEAFIQQIDQSKNKNDVSLIGQFGVGFYSSFIVADKVTVNSKKAGSQEAWTWVSGGDGDFTIEANDKKSHGTQIILDLKEEEKEFLEEFRIKHIVTTYSDHISLPIQLEKTVDGKVEKEKLNKASALWKRNKSEIKEQDYVEFYHHVAHAFDTPWLTLHNQVEGKIEYSSLLFIPTMKPFDLFQGDARESKLKLFTNRVFITDKCSELLPAYLRFVKGVVDTQDLDLNVSREMLQHNPLLTKIRGSLTKKILSELNKIATKDEEKYLGFWEQFGIVLKEGLHDDIANKDHLLKLLRFKTNLRDEFISLAQYIENMQDGQEKIYTISGDSLDMLKQSPHLEGFTAKNIEVLFLTDPVDEFWLPMVENYEEKTFQSITKGQADLNKFSGKDENNKKKSEKKTPEVVTNLVSHLKLHLKDKVKDVRVTDRLTTSPVCLVADEQDMDIHLEKILRQHNRLDESSKRILEVNPDHKLIQHLAEKTDEKSLEANDLAWLLFDQALILEGEVVSDPLEFSKRLERLMERSLAS